MKKQQIIRSSHRNMRGFEYLVYSVFSVMLLTVLILLPLAPVFASENPTELAENDTATTTNEIPNQDISVANADQSVHSDTQIEETEVSENENADALEDEFIVQEPDTELEITNTEEVTELAESTVQGTSTVDIPVTGTSTSDAIPVEDVLVEEISSTTTSIVEDEIIQVPPQDVVEEISDTATSTTEEDLIPPPLQDVVEEIVDEPVLPEINTVTNDENRFSFSKNECTAVGDGTFYCAQPTEKMEVLNTDRVFAAPDADGDMEIFIEKNSELTQITFNTIDDDAPYFDEVSNTLVWQRLIDGRYQIVSYDISDGDEQQITHDRYNNMQPNRYADITVWQGWVGDDWEIFFLKGDELRMLTDNTTHDITPRINGDHVVWQAFLNDVWKMQVYDVRSKMTQTIEDSNGGSIQNPRFVLVYDTKFDSGDVETRGYDLGSGEVIQLGSEPAPVPSKIPDPDQTNEKRALISPQIQPKGKVSDDAIDDQGGPDPEDIMSTSTATSTEDIVVVPYVSENDSPTTTTLSDDINLQHVEDIVISAKAALDKSSTDHVDDLIITPYKEETSIDVNSQGSVAS